MIRNIFFSLLVIVAVSGLVWQMTRNADQSGGAHERVTEHPEAGAEIPKGPHRGKLFEQDGFAVELVVFETGVPPEFRVYAYQDDRPVSPEGVDVMVTLSRLDGQVDRFTFEPQDDYLRGKGVVVEPHSFDIAVAADYQGRSYRWELASYEGRTTIAEAIARESDIETEPAGPQVIVETLPLTGRVVAPPNQMAEVRARFPGVVQRVAAELGDTVKAGTVLARIQSNDSLQNYSLTAPIAGVVLARDIQPGAATGEAPLFLVADLSRVWVELDVFGRDAERVSVGQPVTVEPLNGPRVKGNIAWISPLAVHASQSVQARVVLDNADGRLRPGQFVRARVAVAEHAVELAVRQSAIQKFRDFQVVFARVGDTYEVRMLELGRANTQWVEVTGGLKAGTDYVVANSYLIKADIEKSGASHDH